MNEYWESEWRLIHLMLNEQENVWEQDEGWFTWKGRRGSTNSSLLFSLPCTTYPNNIIIGLLIILSSSRWGGCLGCLSPCCWWWSMELPLLSLLRLYVLMFLCCIHCLELWNRCLVVFCILTGCLQLDLSTSHVFESFWVDTNVWTLPRTQ